MHSLLTLAAVFCGLQFSRFNSGWIILICILLFGNSSLYTKYLAPMFSHSFKIAAIFVTMPDTHVHNINIGLTVTKSIIYQLLFCVLQFSQCFNSDWIILIYFLLFENYSYYILLLHFYFLFEKYIVFFYNNIFRRHEVYQREEWKGSLNFCVNTTKVFYLWYVRSLKTLEQES